MNVTSREFRRDIGKAKRAAANGPVFITDRGRAAHVLLTMGTLRIWILQRPAARNYTARRICLDVPA